MKKSNVTLIATVLVLVHIVIFAAVVGVGRRNRETSVAIKPHATAPAEKPRPHPGPETVITEPKLQITHPTETVMPVEVVEMPTALAREPIARPGTTPGYLRADRPVMRTSKIYSQLVGDPYQGAILVDARSGKILFERRATAYAYPASVTKLMTMLVVLEQIDAGQISLADTVRITDEVSKIGGSQIWLDPRETDFTVDDLLYALMVHSANDAARALALHVAGSKEAFVDMMNQKARELGMNSTVYHSDHGLPPSEGAQPDISTAYDIAILSLAALRHPATLRYAGTELKYLRDGKTMLSNRNALAKRVDGYAGCDGLKTGYHGIGGWSLTATAERNGQRVLSVILGAPDKKTRNDNSRKLLDLGFQMLNQP